MIDLNWNFNRAVYGYDTRYLAWGEGRIPIDITVQSSHKTDFGWSSSVQYEARLMNDSVASPNTYEFDIYVKRKGQFLLETYGLQHCLIFNNSVLNGNTPNCMYINGTSGMNAGQEPPAIINVASVVNGKRVIKMALRIPPAPGSGTIISNTGNGTRFGRFKLTTSASVWAVGLLDLNWNFDEATYGYATKYYGSGGDITDSSSHFNNLTNPILPVELVSFSVSRLDNKQVLLSWSTATETNNYGFEIQRKVISQQSTIGNNDFEIIGVMNGSGNSSSPKNYTYVDSTLTGGSKFAYRLKQIDNNGTFSLSSIQTIELELKDYILSQNYPNPFNPETTIEYIIPQSGIVSMIIYDLLGEKVDEVLDEHKEIGIYKTEYNASKLTSGVYIYVLRSNGNTLSRKMIVAK